jgi:ABC-type enterochelin transport system substrate-binding protein
VQQIGERSSATGTTQSPTSLPDAIAAREAALARKEQSIEAALATVNAAFGILGSRALVILAAAGAFSMFGWAAYTSSGWTMGAAIAFTALVFMPALWIDRRG